MARHDFRMPDIGEGIVDAEVVAWHVALGERVEEDAPLADVMTDKATVEITSPVAGTVVALGCAAGERITIGESLVEFETGGAARATADAAAGSGGASAADASAVGEDDTGAAVTADATTADAGDADTAGAGEEGDAAARGGEPAATTALRSGTRARDAIAPPTPAVTTPPGPATAAPDDRAAAEEPAPASRPGLRLNTPRREDKPHIRVLPELAGGRRRRKVLAAPAVRRRARELGIELSEVLGTGPDGRVLAADLEVGARERERAATAAPARATGTLARAGGSGVATRTRTADRGAGGPAPRRAGTAARLALDEDLPLIGLRRVIAERLAESSRAIPHFTYVEEVDVTELEALRQHLNARRDPSPPRLSLLHFVLLGVCRAVRGWPQCNAHHDDERGTLHCHSAVHLGIATMTDDGLLVPVLRDADALGLDAMAEAVTELAAAARAKRLSRERLGGSTITVTSLGALAGIATTPIINRPETAIIGPNRMTSKLVMEDGQLVERRVMNVSSSFDHRIVDGHDAASFVAELKSLLEHPATLFM